MIGTVPTLTHMPSRRAQGQLYLYLTWIIKWSVDVDKLLWKQLIA